MSTIFMWRPVLFLTIVGLSQCGRLENLYLPPLHNSFQTASNFGSSNTIVREIPILKFSADNNGEGSYKYNYESANKIIMEEQGDAKGDGTRSRGSYSYNTPDGQLISITYNADENGFVPQGSHIPTGPAIPEAIMNALRENAEAEARGIFDDGQYHGEGLDESQYKGEGLKEAQYRDAFSGSSPVYAGPNLPGAYSAPAGYSGRQSNNLGYKY